jgi:hypothetical protein
MRVRKIGRVLHPADLCSATCSITDDSCHMHILVLLVIGALLVTVGWLKKRGRNDKSPLSKSAAPRSEIPGRASRDQVVGDAFDESHLRRQREVFDVTKPPKLRGRVHEIRSWEEKRGFLHVDKVIAFHLDYDRSRTDFGELLVKITKKYFKSLKLEDGDDVELELRWKKKKGKQRALVARLFNLTSGQRLEPSSTSIKAGLIEPIAGRSNER